MKVPLRRVEKTRKFENSNFAQCLVSMTVFFNSYTLSWTLLSLDIYTTNIVNWQVELHAQSCVFIASCDNETQSIDF